MIPLLLVLQFHYFFNIMDSTVMPRESKTKRAGLIMPVGRIERHLRKGRYAKRISSSSSVYMASVLEYLCAEVLELAGNAAKQNRRGRVAPRHIMLAIENDIELKILLKDVVIPEAGVIPNVHPSLLKTQSQKHGIAAVVQASQEL